MIFVRAVHFPLCCPKLHEAAAFSAGALAQGFAAAADIQPAAVFCFIGFFLFGDQRDQVFYFRENSLWVDFLEKAFFAKGTVHSTITPEIFFWNYHIIFRGNWQCFFGNFLTALDLVQQAVHPGDAFFLGGNYSPENGTKLGINAVSEGKLRHIYRAHVVGDHFPDKIRVYAV